MSRSAVIFNIQRFSLHDGPGIRTTFFFKGCNLACAWCANPESHSRDIECAGDSVFGKLYTVDELVFEALKDKAFYEKSGGGVTLSGGEPLMWADFIIELIDALNKEGIAAGIETAAHIDGGIFAHILEKLSFAYIDLKHYDDKRHKQGTGAGNALILQNIGRAVNSGVQSTVRIPVIPGYNASLDDAHGFARLLSDMGAKDVHLLPFHTLGEGKYEKLGREYAYAGMKQTRDEELEPYADIMRAFGLNIRIGG